MPTTRKYHHNLVKKKKEKVLHFKTEAKISVHHEPPEQVISPCTSRWALDSDMRPHSLMCLSLLPHLEWQVTVWVSHWEMNSEHERSNSVHWLFQQWTRYQDLSRKDLVWTRHSGRGRWTGESMRGHLTQKDSLSDWEDNFRRFLSVSFSLEFSSTNQSYPSVHCSPRYRGTES